MKRNDIDWQCLRGALIALIITLVLSSGLVVSSSYFRDRMQREYARSNAQFQSISNKYLSVDEEQKLIKQFFPRFVELYNSGIIGNEQRLNWIEVLRASGEEIKLPSLNYQIESQSVFIPSFAVNLGRYQIFVSNMTLNMSLLHEGDFIRMLDYLNKRAAGIYNPTKCAFDRTTQKVQLDADHANILAKCELSWYTIRLADGTEIQI